MRYMAIAAAAACLGLTACGENKPPRAEDTVFGAQVQALERAREVEETLKRAEQRRREEAEAQIGR